MKVATVILFFSIFTLLARGSEPVLDYQIEKDELKVIVLHEFRESYLVLQLSALSELKRSVRFTKKRMRSHKIRALL